MNKLEMAHEWFIAAANNGHEATVEKAWNYADRIQAEADKRKVGGVPDAILKASNSRELKSEVVEQILHDIDNYFDSSISNSLRDANNVIQEIYESLSGEKKVEDWQDSLRKRPNNK